MEQSVTIHFQYGSKALANLFAVEKRLAKMLTAMNAGMFEGDNIATDGSHGFLYMSGPDANEIFEIIHPFLQRVPFMDGAEVTLRYGVTAPNIKEKTIFIEAISDVS